MDHHDTGLEHDAETVSILYNLGGLMLRMFLDMANWVTKNC